MKRLFGTAVVVLTVILFFTAYFAAVAQARPLYIGVSGSDVRQVQSKLKALGFSIVKIDGRYGWQTAQAVKAFQRRNGLKADGVVGTKTWNALMNKAKPAAAQSSRGGTVSSNDVYVLSKIISGEARGEPYVGQVAVGAVIVNRVRNSNFPNTVYGVVFEPGAFDAVSDGQYYRPPTESAVKAARAAINGWDPTGGALYYWNPATATSRWIWSRPIIARIGKHVFAR
ncbi:spore cortex-lytic enzyme [Thermanaerosceptrum fracticalcis]|uniref:spore cortex-lytic enzyme n=1 Tax=Thermanaerosceptrum fracticalcis TaxID=1712410 RepID=UPI000554762C|nr:spore cortex-lytic enzyme [Thermanaerosceptrum fracticalcis]